MVGAKFCEALVAENLHQDLEITVVGEESLPAYNRVKLSTYVDHRTSTTLEIFLRSWYESHNIDLTTGVRVLSIDRRRKFLTLDSGAPLPYDELILATGSRPFVPPIPGHDSYRVHLYRTIADLDKIILYASKKKSAAVIGGGLLGLEAAQALQSLGLKITLIERANFLMPQQLDQSAADLLQDKVLDQGISLQLGIQNTSIAETSEGLSLSLDDTISLKVDMVLISAGIKPNSELAESAGLPTGNSWGHRGQ